MNVMGRNNKLNKDRSVIGVHISPSSVKLVQTIIVDGRFNLVHTAFREINQSGVPQKGEVFQGLTEVFKNVKSGNNDVVCVINGAQTSVAKVILPAMPESELSQAIRWGATNHFPFSLEKAALDFQVLGKITEGKIVKQSVMVATTTQQMIGEITDFFNPESGHKEFLKSNKLSAIIPTSIALEDLFQFNQQFADKIVAVVEMEKTLTEFNVYKNGIFEYSRKLPVSGQDITQSMTKGLVTPNGKVELTEDEAEQFKIKYGIPSLDKNELIEGKMTGTQMLSLMRPKLELLVNEIERSMEHYQEEFGQEIVKVVALGGQSSMKGLDAFMSEYLNVDVQVGIAVPEIDVRDGVSSLGEGEMAHRLDLAVGAALHK